MINMSEEETWTWDHDEQGWRERVQPRLFARAQEMADRLGRPVTIYSADGITVEQLCPEVRS